MSIILSVKNDLLTENVLLSYLHSDHHIILPCIPLVRAGVIFIGGLEINLALHKANKHSLLIDLPLELKTICRWLGIIAHNTHDE